MPTCLAGLSPGPGWYAPSQLLSHFPQEAPGSGWPAALGPRSSLPHPSGWHRTGLLELKSVPGHSAPDGAYGQGPITNPTEGQGREQPRCLQRTGQRLQRVCDSSKVSRLFGSRLLATSLPATGVLTAECCRFSKGGLQL